MSVLEIQNLTKYYGKTRGVENLSLTLEKGEIFGFIGPNGAGKSTTIRSIMNLINKNEGQILINGKQFSKNDVKTKRKIGYLPGEVYLYDDLAVKEMLDYHEKFYEGDIHKRRTELTNLFELDEKKKIESLSLGNKKKLGIVLALAHSPEILILDEPTSGLDPIMQQTFYNILLEEKEKGTAVLYSTHILSEVSKICDRVGIIKDGHLLKIESIGDIADKNLTFVTITSKDIDKITDELKIDAISRRDDTVRFKNQADADSLIKSLAKYKIDKLLVEEASLEDIFLHYYE